MSFVRTAPEKAAQITAELRALVAVYFDLAPRNVVEIGTWTGGTLYQWLQNASKGTKVISVDLGPRHWVPPVPDFDNSHWWDWCPDGVNLYTLEGDSKDPDMVARAMDILGSGIDFLFIDGDHSYEGVKADWENWHPHVNPGGVVAFHDLKYPVWAPHIQVGKLWDELTKTHTTEEFIAPGFDWGGIGVVYL